MRPWPKAKNIAVFRSKRRLSNLLKQLTIDNTELIDRYLQNEPTENEQLSFKSQLTADSLLTAELQLQQDIIAGIERAGLKNDFSKAIRWQQIIKRTIRLTAAILAVVIAMLVYHQLV